jgi:hypothetical protein
MKKSKVVIPALGLIALSTAASITGTVAWFSANTSVAIRGMQVKTQVSSNLLIATDTLSSTARKGESQFSSGPISDSIKAYLEPVSTVNGTSFFYTLNANADGSKHDGNYVAYNADTPAQSSDYSNKFSEDYGVTKTTVQSFVGTQGPAQAFIDYVFQVKATSTVNDSRLIVSQLNLIYGATSEETNKAFRCAFFVEDISSAAPAGGVGTLNMIYAPSGATYFTPNKAVNSTTTVDTVAYNTANTTLASDIDSGATKYFKVVARLWLEGEDNTCNNETYAALTSDWSLNIELKLDASASPVSAMAKYTSTSYTVSGTPKTFYCDGTNAYKEAENGAIDTTPLTSAACAAIDAGLEAALESAFGITIA